MLCLSFCMFALSASANAGQGTLMSMVQSAQAHYSNCAPPPATALINWTRFHFDSCNTGFNPYEFVLNSTTVGSLSPHWMQTMGDPVESDAALANGMLFVASGASMYGLKASSGAIVWTYTTKAGAGSPAVANGMVYFGSFDHYLYALDAASGKLVWKFMTGDGVDSTPTVVSGVVFFGSEDHWVYALTADQGKQIWATHTNGDVDTSPAVVNGKVYVGSGDGYLYVLDAATGAVRWTYMTGAGIGSSPAVVDGVVYFGSNDWSVYAIRDNGNKGQPVWQYTTKDIVLESPAVANGFVYVSSEDGNLYAFHAKDGTIAWVVPTGATGGGYTPAVADDVVYVAWNQSIYGLYAYTGTMLWQYTTGGFVGNSPAIVNGVIYIGSGDGNLYSFGL
jgi:outer membrane protein assembly factor BamB